MPGAQSESSGSAVNVAGHEGSFVGFSQFLDERVWVQGLFPWHSIRSKQVGKPPGARWSQIVPGLQGSEMSTSKLGGQSGERPTSASPELASASLAASTPASVPPEPTTIAPAPPESSRLA